MVSEILQFWQSEKMRAITKIKNMQENLRQLQCHNILLYSFNFQLQRVMEVSLGKFVVIFNNYYSAL